MGGKHSKAGFLESGHYYFFMSEQIEIAVTLQMENNFCNRMAHRRHGIIRGITRDSR